MPLTEVGVVGANARLDRAWWMVHLLLDVLGNDARGAATSAQQDFGYEENSEQPGSSFG